MCQRVRTTSQDGNIPMLAKPHDEVLWLAANWIARADDVDFLRVAHLFLS